jgi:hypothetical protein
MLGMNNKRRASMRAVILLLLFAVMASIGWQVRDQRSSQATPAMRPMGVSGGVTASGGSVVEAPVVNAGNGTLVGHSVKNDVSPALRDIKPIPAQPWTTVREMTEPRGENSGQADSAPPVNDSVVQKSFGPSMLMPAPITNFAGVGNVDGVYPPDTNGDVGPNHYVQWVNLHFQIWNKNGVSLYGPAAGNTLWTGFGGPCASQNAGDPIVLYDQAADRWVLSQFTSSAPYGECIAVSTTGDPTGSYYRYFFQHSTSEFYDYPHMGVWPDGYYTGFNRFGSVFYNGPSAIVYDRAKMLLGQPATYQEKQLGTGTGTLISADVDGPTMPPAGTPGFFVSRAASSLQLFKFHVDWATPANSTLTSSSLAVAAYNQLCSGTRSCIPQPGTTVKLDGIGDRIMYRVAYRNFGTHESLVTNHSVDVDSTSAVHAGVRWYEIRNPNGAASIFQQGTYAPDAANRWMGSIAQDAQGNMALGYSVASSSVFPGIRYTGRLVSDPLGQLSQGETVLINGSGSQTGTASRWGDYSAMQVDPVDDCTFWYTTEYLASTGGAPWVTRIGSFKYPGCSAGPQPTPTNTPVPVPTNTPTNTPVPPPPTNTPTPGPANSMHVGDLDGSATSSGNSWTARVVVTVHDANENTVSGATVSGTWSVGGPGSGSCTTDSLGQCTVTSNTIRKNIGSTTFSVSGVVHATLTYNQSANHDPDGDSNGTSISVSKP